MFKYYYSVTKDWGHMFRKPYRKILLTSLNLKLSGKLGRRQNADWNLRTRFTLNIRKVNNGAHPSNG
jgi:hypothetical protein